jgi:hypothetical protein
MEITLFRYLELQTCKFWNWDYLSIDLKHKHMRRTDQWIVFPLSQSAAVPEPLQRLLEQEPDPEARNM